MKAILSDLSAIFLTILISLAYWAGNATVPFHPDESTQIYMSADLELSSANFPQLFWDPAKVNDVRQNYRLLDAPLTRDLIGLGRSFADLPAISVDWDWSKIWAQNAQAGALPSPQLLQTARLSVDWLFPVSLVLIYLAGRSIAGPRLGIISLVLLAGNALVLLHTRRAMAESVLLCGAALSVWAVMAASRRPWLAAIPAALAFAAKQSGAAFMAAPAGLIIVQFIHQKGKLMLNLGLALAAFILVTLLLNPFLWRNPPAAVAAAFSARQNLANQQVLGFQSANPALVPGSLLERTALLTAQMYFTPLQFSEAANYADQTRPAEMAYSANPLNTLLRSVAGGILLLFLTLAGAALAILRVRNYGASEGRGLILLLASAVAIFLVLLLLPVIFQRYVIPLVLPATIMAGYSIDQASEWLLKIYRGQLLRRPRS